MNDRQNMSLALQKNCALTAERDRREEFDQRDLEEGGSRDQILIYTAYSSDYTIGRLCEKVNHDYATKHGYKFVSIVVDYEEMIKEVSPKQHCTWYKMKVVSYSTVAHYLA